MKLKIANIIYDLDNGGAAIALGRLNKIFEKNFESKIIRYRKDELFFTFINFLKITINKIIKKFLLIIFNLKYENTTNFNLFSSYLLDDINKSNFNLINLHWIGNDTLSLNDIGKINKKVIITLHDMWPYTAIEHYIDTKEYLKKYTHNSKNNKNLFINKIFNKKIESFKNISNVICTSKWQKKMAEKSLVLKHAKKILIPLPLNFDYWKPIDKKKAKKELNIYDDYYSIFLPLSNIYAGKRKGVDLLISALNKINNIKIILITTNYKNIYFKNKNIIHVNLLTSNSSKDLIKIYSATDLFLMPSRYESFGQTLLEAQACNCPAVVFKNTGCEDLVLNKINGYKAKYLNIDDLIKGINWCYRKFYKKKNNHIRNIAIKKFSNQVVLKKYKNFFNDLSN
tara:strand:+ start:4573 stop:5766 length:1194 start_codon:yes stop_codon:yes gene_type:complete